MFFIEGWGHILHRYQLLVIQGIKLPSCETHKSKAFIHNFPKELDDFELQHKMDMAMLFNTFLHLPLMPQHY